MKTLSFRRLRNNFERQRFVFWLVDVALAMEPLQLPAYVLLWIVEWLHRYQCGKDVVGKEKLAIDVLQGVRNSARKIEQRRRPKELKQ